MKFLTGMITAWTDDEAQRHGCRGGASVRIDETTDRYIARIRREEFVDVYIPWECVDSENEDQIRALIKQGCEALNSGVREKLK